MAKKQCLTIVRLPAISSQAFYVCWWHMPSLCNWLCIRGWAWWLQRAKRVNPPGGSWWSASAKLFATFRAEILPHHLVVSRNRGKEMLRGTEARQELWFTYAYIDAYIYMYVCNVCIFMYIIWESKSPDVFLDVNKQHGISRMWSVWVPSEIMQRIDLDKDFRRRVIAW